MKNLLPLVPTEQTPSDCGCLLWTAPGMRRKPHKSKKILFLTFKPNQKNLFGIASFFGQVFIDILFA